MTAARVAVLFLFHAAVFTACYLTAEWLRGDFAFAADARARMPAALVYVVAVQLCAGAAFRFYRGWWRYVSINDAIRLGTGLTAALAVLMTVRAAASVSTGLASGFAAIPASVLVVDWSLALLVIFGARVAVRLGKERFLSGGSEAPLRRVLIIGAGDAGEAVAREIIQRPQLGMVVAAFVDDKKAKWHAYIRGVAVLGPIEDVGRIARETNATEALITLSSAPGKRIREITEQLIQANLQFKIIPGVDQMMTGAVQVSHLRKVNVEDLMRRAPVTLPGDVVRQLFAGKRVVVTGAGGTIGSELAAQILEFQPETIDLVERSENALYEVSRRIERLARPGVLVRRHLVDVRDDAAVRALLAQARPHVVLHAAAHKHVPLGEEHAFEYLQNNCVAARALAEACAGAGVDRFVFISTDKAINPVSVMGATKRAAEILLLSPIPDSRMKISIVRFGNVLGSSGSVVPLFMEQIAAGGPVTVTHPDATRYFLRTSEAVALVLQTGALGDAGNVYMLDMGTPVNIADLARDLIRLSNPVDDIEIVFTGLRPGERLFEEIQLSGESVRPTLHPQIVVTQPPQPSSIAVSEWLRRALDVNHDSVAVKRLLRDLLPEYQPAVTHGPLSSVRVSPGAARPSAQSGLPGAPEATPPASPPRAASKTRP